MKKLALVLWVVLFVLAVLAIRSGTDHQESVTPTTSNSEVNNIELTGSIIEVGVDPDEAVTQKNYLIPSDVRVESDRIQKTDVVRAYGKEYMNYSVRISAVLPGNINIDKDKTGFYHSGTILNDSVIRGDFANTAFSDEDKYYTIIDNRIYLTISPFTAINYSHESATGFRVFELRVVADTGQGTLNFYLPII